MVNSLGGLPLPDIAGFAAGPAPVGDAEIHFERMRESPGVCLEHAHAGANHVERPAAGRHLEPMIYANLRGDHEVRVRHWRQRVQQSCWRSSP